MGSGRQAGPLADKAAQQAQQRREWRAGLCLHGAQALGEGDLLEGGGLPAKSPPGGWGGQGLLGPRIEWWRVSLGRKNSSRRGCSFKLSVPAFVGDSDAGSQVSRQSRWTPPAGGARKGVVWVQKKRKNCFSLRESGKGLGGLAALGLDLQRQGGAPQEAGLSRKWGAWWGHSGLISESSAAAGGVSWELKSVEAVGAFSGFRAKEGPEQSSREPRGPKARIQQAQLGRRPLPCGR